MKLKVLIIVVGVVQLILGAAYLFMPQFLLQSMGHSIPPLDINYPLGMLAARFIVYGAMLIMISNAPLKNHLWLSGMIYIQLIDLAVGIFYTASGIVPLSLSGFPMFNASLIAILLWIWRPRAEAI